jgi:hypothetical protein
MSIAAVHQDTIRHCTTILSWTATGNSQVHVLNVFLAQGSTFCGTTFELQGPLLDLYAVLHA